VFTFADIRYAARVLLRSPGFSIVAIVTLALGVGLNVTVFSILNVLLLKPTPVANAAQLAWVTGTSAEDRFRVMSYPDLLDFKTATPTVRDVAGIAETRMAVRVGNQAVRLPGQVVTGNFFDVLGVRPAQGRLLTATDDRSAGDAAVAVLSDVAARRLFAAAPDAVGALIDINGQTFTVVGVATPDFRGADVVRPADVWVPIAAATLVIPGLGRPLDRNSWWLTGIARLGDGVQRTSAEAALRGIASDIAARYPESHKDTSVALHAFQGTNPEDRSKMTALALLPAVPLTVLLIACANVASLLMARGTARKRELAVRAALGARRSRLVGQLFVESALLALAGGTGALLISLWAPELLLRFADAEAIATDFAPDLRVMAFTLLVSTIAAVAFGLGPALKASRLLPGTWLRAEPGAAAPGSARLQRFLVAGQLALSLVLLVATTAFVTSVARAAGFNPGFDTKGRVTLSLDLKMQRYSDARALAFERDVVARLEAIPGIRSAALAQNVPLGGTVELTSYYPAGRPIDREARAPRTTLNRVGAGFFETIGLPVRLGRTINDGDVKRDATVVVVNETLARVLATDGNAVGAQVIVGSADSRPLDVVGVVADAVVDEFGEPPQPAVYLPRDGRAGELSIIAWTAIEPAVALRAIESEIHAIDGSLAVFDPMTMDAHLADRMDAERGLSRVLGVAGSLALGLAAFGLYGVTAYAVSRRTREIGVRIALGASRSGILGMVFFDAARLAAGGIVAGLIPGCLLTYLLSGLVYGVEPVDIRALTGATAILVAASALASYLPARSALRVDPVRALRTE
jgi:predicted permease